jgi:two-component system LytT family sensor kinase
MHINRQTRQLVKITGSINGLFLLLCVSFAIYIGYGYSEHLDIFKRLIKFILAFTLCWIVNLSVLVFFVPLKPKWKNARWLFFYLPSYLVTIAVGMIIAKSFLMGFLSDEPQHSTISGIILFVTSINSISLLAIELILSRYAQADIRIEYANMKAENAELRMKSMEAQHEKLKNQLHPHFLFNSLTALKSLIRKDPELAENYLIKLSGFLRFSMSHNEQNVVPLEEELKFSLYYLEMQKIRFRQAITYDVQIPAEQSANALLPVFSLQLTLENAIKHNRLTQEKPLHIVMRCIEPDWLVIENNVQAKLIADAPSGIGLKNLSDRYKLLINEDIKIENDADCFRVYLKIIRP